MRDRRKYYDIPDDKIKQQQTASLPLDNFNKTERGKIVSPCWLFLDQSTRAGYSLWDNEGRIVLSGVVEADKKNDSVQKFGHEFSKMIEGLIEEFSVENIFYEEVYDKANKRTTEVLYYIKHKITDIGYNNENISVYPLDHRKWKNLLAGKNDKYDFSKDNKKETQKFVEEVYPLLTIITDDESDAIGMGIAILIRDMNRRNLYKLTRYNKKLPIHQKVTELDINMDTIDYLVKNKKINKSFRDAYEVGGLYELELDRGKKIETTVRKYLSHKDVLLYVKIPKSYKYWGYMLLVNGINPDNLIRDDESFIYLVARKRRL